jgi:hypothetical protein
MGAPHWSTSRSPLTCTCDMRREASDRTIVGVCVCVCVCVCVWSACVQTYVSGEVSDQVWACVCAECVGMLVSVIER